MAPRATWKGWLKLLDVTSPVALYTAAPETQHIALHTLNRETGHRLKREFVDEVTGDVVERDEQAKGFEVTKDRYIVLEQEEIDAAIPESTKVLSIEAFVPSADVDEVYLDSPYYLSVAERAGAEGFALIHKAMQDEKVAAIARTVLFRRDRVMLLCPREEGFLAFTLHYDYEVRPEKEIFGEIPDLDIPDEMLDLGRHIVGKKMGKFDPSTFEDRYDEALAELIRAKQAGKPLPRRAAPAKSNVVDLMDALRQSAGLSGDSPKAAGGKKKPRAAAAKKSGSKEAKPAGRRKAG